MTQFSTHQQRVIDEKAARDGEISRLAAFIDGNAMFSTLPADEQARMRRQLDVMRELSVILGERISAFGEAVPSTQAAILALPVIDTATDSLEREIQAKASA